MIFPRLTLRLYLLSALLLTACSPLHSVQEVGALVARADEAGYVAWRASMAGPDPLEQLTHIKTWCDENLTYKADGIIDYPRAAAVTWTIRTGDCDDWSFLILDALAAAGHVAKLVSVDNFHTVCAVENAGGLLWHASNWAGVRGPFATLAEIATSIRPEWKIVTVRNRNLNIIERLVR